MAPVDILLAEDNATDLELTVHVLRQNRLANRLQVVRDGTEVIDFFFGEKGCADHRHPRVVLLDIKMPKVDGLEVLHRIRSDERTLAIPVVLLTSSHEDRDIERGYRLGANSYIVKPVEFGKLAEVVRQLGMYWLVVNEPPVSSR